MLEVSKSIELLLFSKELPNVGELSDKDPELEPNLSDVEKSVILEYWDNEDGLAISTCTVGLCQGHSHPKLLVALSIGSKSSAENIQPTTRR